ncbi:MAG: hypothetical protein EZS28_051508, partial [Streblomastix strix]
MKDKDQKLPPVNVGAFILDLFQMKRERLANGIHEDEKIFGRKSQLTIQKIKVQYSQKGLLLLSITIGFARIERITIEEMMKRDTELILTEVIAFHTRQKQLSRIICFFRPNEIAEIRLKFSNVDKTENQASLRLAPKQANAIETYEVYETDNEELSPKLAIYEWIDRLKKQFPKGTDFLLWHKG